MKTTTEIVRRALQWSGMVIITMLMQCALSAQTLVHEYSFSDAGPTNVADSIGGPTWDGIILTSGTNAAPGPGGSVFTGSQLLLSGSSQDFVQLPAGILSNYTAVTIDAWVATASLPNNCFLWAFGDTDVANTNTYSGGAPSGYDCIFCQPLAGALTISTADPSWQGGHTTPNVGSFGDGNEWHITAVINPPAGYIELYTNGVLAARNSDVTEQMNQISNVINYLGRSLYWADGFYDSSWDEFRIWNGALNSLQVAGCDANGPDNTNDNYGTVTSVQLNVPNYTMPQGTFQSATVMAQASALPKSVDITGLASFSSSNPSILTVSNNVISAVGQGAADIIASYDGLSSTQTITAVAATVPTLMHRYSFTTDASDSVGGAPWAGTLNGSASISGGQLVLPNTSNVLATDFLQLPAGILTNSTDGVGTNFNDPAVTIEAWTTIAPSQWTWANLFDFGVQSSKDGLTPGNDAYSISMCVHSGGTASTIAAISDSDDANVHRQNLSIPTVLDGHTAMHVAVVFNPPAGYSAIYTNGVLMGKNTSITISMAGVQGIRNIIGADNWPDSGMKGSVDEFRIWNGALSSQEIALSDAAGADSIPSTVTNGPGSFVSMTLQVPATMQWLQVAPLKVLANYSNLTNFDLVGNSIFPPTGLTVTSSDTNVVSYNAANAQVTALKPGTSTISVTYQGITNTQLVTVIAPTAQLMHEYSFNDANGSTSVVDSVGGPAWDGTVMAGGTNGVPSGGAFTNGMLYINSSNMEYVQLPSGILSNYSAVTIDTWVTMGSLPNACALFNFGNTDPNVLSGNLPSGEDYIFCQPYDGRVSISTNDAGWQGTGEQTASSGVNWQNRTNFHVTAVVNPAANYIAVYTNGVMAAINTSVTQPLSGTASVLNFIARSLYDADSYMNVSVDEFRIYNGALSPDDVATNQLLGPNQVPVSKPLLSAVLSGNNVTLSWPGSAVGFTPQSRTSLTTGSWTNITSPAPQLIGNLWQVTVPKAGNTAYFRLIK